VDDRRRKKREKRLKKKRERDRRFEDKDRAFIRLYAAAEALRSDDLDGAVRLAKKAADIDPSLIDAFSVLASASADRGDWAEATKAALVLHRLLPEEEKFLLWVMDGYLRQGKVAEARDFLAGIVEKAGRENRSIPRSLVEFLARVHGERFQALFGSGTGRRKRSPKKRAVRNGPPADKELGPLFEAPADPSPAPEVPPPAPEPPAVEFSFRFEPGPVIEAVRDRRSEDGEAFALRLAWERLHLLGEYDELLCLSDLAGVDRYAFQIGTVRRVLRQFRGRVLLADEVGLGKTIEAGMILKEYVLRGLVRTALVLVPAPLVGQWAEELESKFSLAFETTDGGGARRDPGGFWAGDRVIASIQTARRIPHLDRVTGRDWDLVVVDEAHALRNRTTANWKLVNAVRKRFLLLLTATPVQNDLDELYNLVTLLRPGTFRTPAEFRREFVDRGDPRKPRNSDRLREILRTVMVRNTRAAVDVRLPPRYAATHVVDEPEEFRAFYGGLSAFLRARIGKGGNRLAIRTLLMEAGSSPEAVGEALVRMREKEPDVPEIGGLLSACRSLGPSMKSARLVEILRAGRTAKTVVFTQFRPTLIHLARVLDAEGIPFAVFSGAMSNPDKDRAVERFREEVPVLLASESGGQGKNLQFASGLVNYDLPWNPLRIEQRIGRIHRIGQEREVFVFNLCVSGTVEEDLLRLLDEKLRMFELVVGEVGAILGNLPDDRDFAEIVTDLWASAADPEARRESFEALGDSLLDARRAYLEAKEIDQSLFAEEYEA